MPDIPEIPGFPFGKFAGLGGKPYEGDVPGVAGADVERRQRDEFPLGDFVPGPPAVPPWPPKTAADYAACEEYRLWRIAHDRAMLESMAYLFNRTLRNRFMPAQAPPWIEFPFHGLHLHAVGSVAIANAATTNIVTFLTGINEYAVVRWFGHDTQNVDAGTGFTDWANTTWDIGLDPSGGTTPTLFYDGYRAWSGQIGQVEAPISVCFIVPPGHRIIVRATNTTGAEADFEAVIRGWRWQVNGDENKATDHLFGMR